MHIKNKKDKKITMPASNFEKKGTWKEDAEQNTCNILRDSIGEEEAEDDVRKDSANANAEKKLLSSKESDCDLETMPAERLNREM